MAGGMKIDWHGTEKLTMFFSGSGNKVREQSAAVVKNNAELVQRFAKVYAPKDTGFLESEIKTSYPKDLEAHITNEAAYAGYQEYGTRYQKGKPHMKPALKVIEPKFKQEMTKVMKGAFNDS